jgi:hypothetical protein
MSVALGWKVPAIVPQKTEWRFWINATDKDSKHSLVNSIVVTPFAFKASARDEFGSDTSEVWNLVTLALSRFYVFDKWIQSYESVCDARNVNTLKRLFTRADGGVPRQYM